MNKKAASIMMMIFEVIVVSLVIYITISIAHAYGSSLLTFKINVAEDIRMMTDTLIGVPGDAMVEYPTNVSELSFILRGRSISVFEAGEPEMVWVVRKFFLPIGYTAEGTLQASSRLCLEKKATKILLRGCAYES